MLTVPIYEEKWDCKYDCHKTNGYLDRLINSEDRPDGSISSPEIERIALAHKHILMEDDE